MKARLTPKSAHQQSLALFNPRSANSSTQAEWLQSFETCGGLVLASSNQTELNEALGHAQAGDRKRLIVIGGDGSIACVVNALGSAIADYEIAIIPSGTGNDFARSLDLPIDDPQSAWGIALSGVPQLVDLVEVTGVQPRCFVNTITAGFGGRQASDLATDDKPQWGKMAYWAAAAAQLGDMPEFEVALRSSQRTETIRCFGFWLANGRYVGGGFPVAPEALLDDGLLDVVVVPSMPALELLAAGIDVTLAGPQQSDYLLTFRVDEIAVTMTPEMPLSIDGEAATCSSMECHVLRHALRIIAGNTNPASGSGVAANEK